MNIIQELNKCTKLKSDLKEDIIKIYNILVNKNDEDLNITMKAVTMLLNEQILSPLTLDDEWIPVNDIKINSRYKDVIYFNNKYVYTTGIIWVTSHGNEMTGEADYKDVKFNSSVKIKSFPFTPKIFYVPVIKDGDKLHITDTKELTRALEYYDKL